MACCTGPRRRPLFRGSTQVTLTVGRGTGNVDVPLDPVIAAVACAGPQVEFTAYGETAQLSGVALFASTDRCATRRCNGRRRSRRSSASPQAPAS